MNKLILITLLFICTIADAQRIRTVNFGQKTYIPGDGGGTATDGHFDFQIYSAVKTSAGVFRYDSTLVRTLWADRQYIFPGTYRAYWDNKDDYGVAISSPDANYEVRVLSNNLQYTWQGVIGNSSTLQTGPTIHKGGYHCMRGLVFIGSTGYYCTGYGEGAAPMSKFNTATPQERTRLSIHGDINYVATDGNLVYWEWHDAQSVNNNMVIATNPLASDAAFIFTNGAAYGSHVQSGISVTNVANSTITGLAVQPTGDHLFVARGGLDNLYVLNKTTGAAIRTLSFTNIHSIACDNSNNLWILYGTNTIQKYSVDASGILTSIGVVSGSTPDNPLSIWYGNGLLAVCEGGNSQVVKFYNNSTRAYVNTLGTPGGYYANSDVTNTKFYFSDVNGEGTQQYSKKSFVAWQTDNSYWLGDPGNLRVQHFNSSNTFINMIMSQGACYSVFIDRGNINRLFVEHLEFEMDYSVQQLTGSTGWVLKRNWGSNIPVPTYDGQPRWQTTMNNGRTYGLIRKGNDFEVIEFVSGGNIRFTGIILFQQLSALICANGDMQYTTHGGADLFTVYRQSLIGFNANGDPQWAAGVALSAGNYNKTVGSPVNSPSFEVMDITRQKVVWYEHTNRIDNNAYAFGYFGQLPLLSTTNWILQSQTDNRRVRINALAIVNHTKMHLGVMPLGATNTWTWQTERSTQQNYIGDYPPVPYFDCGNLVQGNAGSGCMVLDRNIIVGYKGEFWKNSQTNKYNHYWDDGLALGQFGVAYNEVAGQEAAAGMAGNANTPILVKDATGDLYLYHGDEGHHAGAHRWKISGMNSLREQKIQIKNPTTYSDPPVTYTDLMAGLPFDVSLVSGTAGWTRSPATDILINPFGDYWSVWTSKYTPPNNYRYNDIWANAVMPNLATYYVERPTNITTNVSTNWKLTGAISFGASNTGGISERELWFDILDENGLIISRITQNGSFQQPTVLHGNNGVIKTGDPSVMLNELSRELPMEISAEGGNITFKIGTYPLLTVAPKDGSANWRRPSKIKITIFKGGGGTQGLEIFLKNLWLYKDF